MGVVIPVSQQMGICEEKTDLVIYEQFQNQGTNSRMEVEVLGRIRCAYSSARTLSSAMYVESKRVWVWTEIKQVMMATMERGWKTLVLGSKSHELADEWSRHVSATINTECNTKRFTGI